MKFRKTQSRAESGSVLATTLVITFVIGLTLASFLVLTQHQTFANARSQSWNNTMAVSESGVEDALQMINRYAGDPVMLEKWADDVQAGGLKADGWVYRGNNLYTSTRTIGNPATARYVVTIDNSRPAAPEIRAEGWLTYDYEYNHPSGTTPGIINPDLDGNVNVTLAVAGTTGGKFRKTQLTRTVEVTTRRDGFWTLAMLAEEIDLNGNNISTDSFDSADPNASDWDAGVGYGTYDVNERKDNGDIATNQGIVDSLNVGNANIMGHASTGPGGTIAIGPNGSVGSEAWVTSGRSGIQPDYSSDDMNVRFNDISLPVTHWFGLPTVGGKGTNIDGVVYQHVILTSGDYRASTLQGSVYVGPGVQARIHVTDTVKLTGDEEIRIDPDAQGLQIYMSGSTFLLAGNGVVNETGKAEAFLYFGLPSNRKLAFAGNADFAGAIYANHADFYLGGGGKTTYDFIGASVSRTVTMNGSYNFHYDEDLENYGPSRGFIPTTWSEL